MNCICNAPLRSVPRRTLTPIFAHSENRVRRTGHFGPKHLARPGPGSGSRSPSFRRRACIIEFNCNYYSTQNAFAFAFTHTHTLDTRSESAVEVVLPFRMPKAENDVAYAGVAATAAVAEWVLGCMQRWLGCALARSTGRETETLSQQTGQVAWNLHKHTHTDIFTSTNSERMVISLLVENF